MKRLQILSALVFLAFASYSARSQDITAYDFLRVPMNARAAALGNTFITMMDDPASIFHNPAAISTLQKPSASLGFVKYLLDVNAGYVSYGQELAGAGHIGAGVMYMNYGEFDRVDKFAVQTGTFSASDLAVSVGYSDVYEGIHFGGAVKFIHSSIESYSSSAYALDLGGMYHLTGQNITFGLAIQNIGGQLSKFDQTAEDLPFNVVVGVSHQLKHLPLNIGLNFHKLNQQDDRFGNFTVGGEFQLSKSLRARFGYNAEQRRELKIGSSAGFTGMSLGLGLNVSDYLFDYGFNSLGEIGSIHRFSLSTAF